MVEPGPETLPFAGKRVRVFLWEDRTSRDSLRGQLLYSPFDKNRCVNQGTVVENERLGAALSVIQASQLERE